MIIKNLARKDASSGQLVKYIFKYIFRDHEKGSKNNRVYDRPVIPRGVRISKQDWKFLKAEQIDKKLLADFKAKYPNYDYKAYIQNHLLLSKDGGKDKPSPFIIRHNMRAISLNGFIREFEANERGRIHKRVDQTSIHHTIISFSNKDSSMVTEKMLREISKEYIRLRGEKNMYVGTVHTDKSHIHLHIAMSGTTIEGKSARISQKEFENVKVKLQEYQLKHYAELIHSLPQHGKAKEEKQKEELQKIIRSERSDGKHSILQCIETNYPKATSTEQFISVLNQHGYTAYYRNGTLSGIQNEQGYKYRFSRLGVDVERLHQLDTQLAKEKETLKELRHLRGGKSRDLRLSEIKEDSKNELAVELSTEHESTELKEIHELRAGYENDRDNTTERDILNDSDRDHIDDQPTHEIDDQPVKEDVEEIVEDGSSEDVSEDDGED